MLSEVGGYFPQFLGFAANLFGRGVVRHAAILNDEASERRAKGLVVCGQSAVAVRFCTRLSCAEFTFLSRCGPTSRATDGEYLLEVAALHVKSIVASTGLRLLNLDHSFRSRLF
jgi:hypothetical protein